MPIQWTGLSPDVLIPLNRNSGEALRTQLERGLRDAIRSGRLRADEKLPSTRELVRGLGISRGMVVDCFDQLQAEGYLVARGGSATRVSPSAQRPLGEASLSATAPISVPARRPMPRLIRRRIPLRPRPSRDGARTDCRTGNQHRHHQQIASSHSAARLAALPTRTRSGDRRSQDPRRSRLTRPGTTRAGAVNRDRPVRPAPAPDAQDLRRQTRRTAGGPRRACPRRSPDRSSSRLPRRRPASPGRQRSCSGPGCAPAGWGSME